MQKRLLGLDLARSLAVFGMVIVNFMLVMGATDDGSLWYDLAASLQGRAVAVFVVLAGMGLMMFASRRLDQSDGSTVLEVRLKLCRRGLLLFVIGLAYTPIWPADILHFYGLYFLLGAVLITAGNRTLWTAIASLLLGFVLLLMLFDYSTGWNFETLEYLDLWTVEGMLRHLFFNGFHPVVPWAAFLLLGMWLARLQLSEKRSRLRLMGLSALLWLSAEFASRGLISIIDPVTSGLLAEDIVALFGTAPMPPMPLYMLAGGSLAVLLITLCLILTDWLNRFAAGKALLQPFLRTGRMSLTLYILHVLLGMGVLEAMGLLQNQPFSVAISAALLFNLFALIFAWGWLRFFRTGPFEWVFRKLAG